MAEAVPESPTDMGNTKGFHDPSDDATTAGGLHDPSDDATTTGGLQVIQPIQVNHGKHIFSPIFQLLFIHFLLLF